MKRRRPGCHKIGHAGDSPAFFSKHISWCVLRKIYHYCPYRLRWLDHCPFKAADPDRYRVGTPINSRVAQWESTRLIIERRWIVTTRGYQFARGDCLVWSPHCHCGRQEGSNPFSGAKHGSFPCQWSVKPPPYNRREAGDGSVTLRTHQYAIVAQLVERGPEESGVSGSIPLNGTKRTDGGVV